MIPKTTFKDHSIKDSTHCHKFCPKNIIVQPFYKIASEQYLGYFALSGLFHIKQCLILSWLCLYIGIYRLLNYRISFIYLLVYFVSHNYILWFCQYTLRSGVILLLWSERVSVIDLYGHTVISTRRQYFRFIWLNLSYCAW